MVNGGPGALVLDGQQVIGVAALDIAGGQIKGIAAIVNPDKLMHLRAVADGAHLHIVHGSAGDRWDGGDSGSFADNPSERRKTHE
jgi:hypothetical protein